MGQPKKLAESEQQQRSVRTERLKQKVSEDVVANRKTWQAAIDKLTQTQFQSMELALTAVAEQVLARLGMKPTQDLLDFVLLILETDPVASEAIEQLVK